MEEDLLQAPPEYKLYKDNSIRVATFLGGPLVAGYLIAENYKKLGQEENMKKTWGYSVAATILIFGAVFMIPAIKKTPNFLIPLIYSSLTYYLVQRFQGSQIKSHIEGGGQLYSIWRALLASLIGLIITVAVIFLVILLTGKEII
jgi:hypothetical protein